MRDFDSDGNRLLLPLGASKLAEDAYLSLLLEQDLNIPDDVIDELLDLNLVAFGEDGLVPQPASAILQEALDSKFAEVKN